MEPGTLYLVSTPIGHLGDISHRALEVLRGVDVVLAEDTRRTRVLLDHYKIRTPTTAFHEHNEARSVPRILSRLARGESAALVSDAGTPLLSDPGQRLVRAARSDGLPVVPVPGASALLAALVASGMDAERFTFFGFLPRSGTTRTSALRDVSAIPHTGVLYEAPGRLAKTLRDLDTHGAGERQLVVARELTKLHEEFRRGTVAELAQYYATSPPRGEVVLVLEGRREDPIDEMELRDSVSQLRAQGVSARDIAATLVREHGVSRNAAYRLAHDA